MNRRLGAALAAKRFVGAVGDHLVEVHVGLGAGAGLPDHKRKMIVELAVDHLARGADDGAGAALIEEPEFAVGFRRRQLDDAERVDDFDRHPVVADAEIPPPPFGLRAPVAVGGDLDRTEAVGLSARRSGSGCCCRSSHGRGPLREAAGSEPAYRRLRAVPSVYRSRGMAGADYFLRKRSNRTTSAPSPGFAGSLSGSGDAAAAGGAGAAGTAGRFFAGTSLGASVVSNCMPNCTDGSRKLLI